MKDRKMGGGVVTIQSMLRALPMFAIACWAVSSISTAPTYGQVINEEMKLLTDDGIYGDLFGNAIDTDGSVIVIGARGNDLRNSGSAYLFDASTGEQLDNLVPDDISTWDGFGSSVAISGGIAAIGSPGDDDVSSNAGAVYFFNATTGEQIRKILAFDGNTGDEFGRAVAIADGVLAVGVPKDDDKGLSAGSVYLYAMSDGSLLHKLTASDGETNDQFGESISINDGVVVVGAWGEDGVGIDSGAAYVFDVGTGNQLAKLVASDAARDDGFGSAVGVDDGVIVIGAWGEDGISVGSGSAYLFDVATWTEYAKILPPDDGVFGTGFGSRIDVHMNTVVVGMHRKRAHGLDSGAAYLFDATTGLQRAEILPSDGKSNDDFGVSVAVLNDLVVIGASGDDDNGGEESGSAYVYDVSSAQECLGLFVNNLVAGDEASFFLNGGLEGAKAVTVYGTKAGQTVVNNISGYCATFAIKGVSQDKVLGGLNRTFDATGEITFNQFIPSGATGANVLFQSAMQGTCPDECVSNVVEMTVQ